MARNLTENDIQELLMDENDSESDPLSDFEPCDEDNLSDNENPEHEATVQSSDSSSDHVLEESEEEEGISLSSNTFYRGKNRFKWSKTPPSSSRIRSHNIITHLPGIVGPARDKQHMSPIESWQLLIPDEMIQTICTQTNQKIREYLEKYKTKASYTNHVTILEMKAFFGLLLLSGVFKSGHEDIESLWATDGTGRDIFRVTMNVKRFMFLLSALRFDDVTSREERRTNDRAALITEVFESFIANCQNNYSCSEYVTIDEMLCPFRGKCFFRIYMKSKPAKYGIKIMCLCDSKTHYLYNAFIYTGKSTSNRRGQVSIPTQNVLKLAEPLFGTKRNITADNWFSSVELVDKLLEHNLTYVGTMRKNKREIPSEFLPKKEREVGSTLFGFVKDKTLASYVPKRNSSVVMISSMHHDNSIDDTSGKPEIIIFYNSTKGGVDALDQKCANYSVSRRTQRWPCVIFSAILNIASANGFVLWKASNSGKRMKRNHYIKQIGQDLIRPFVIERRAVYSSFSMDLKNRIDNFLGSSVDIPQNVTQQGNETSTQSGSRKRGRCYLCGPKIDNKQSQKCDRCCKFICKIHVQKRNLCSQCLI